MRPLDVIAAFDIGSNSIKMSVGRRDPDGTIREILVQAETTRLGAGIETTGRLAEASVDASLDALRRFISLSRQFGASRFVGVATEAVRVAANGAEFLATMQNELGLEIVTISGDEEARLTFAGLPEALRGSGSILVADIGGASTELIAATDGQVDVAVSYQIGSGRFTDRFVPSNPPSPRELQDVKVAAFSAVNVDQWPPACDKLLIVGGTGEYLRVLLGHDWPAKFEELQPLLDELTKVPSTSLASRISTSESRARVLPAGIAMVAALAELSVPDELHGAPSGIRLGLLQSAFGESRQ